MSSGTQSGMPLQQGGGFGSGGLVLTREDRIFVRTHNSAAGVVIGLRARLLDETGRITESAWQTTPASDRTASFVSFDAGRGLLLGLTLRAESGTVRRGQCFVQVGIVRGGALASEPVQLLLSGYITGDSILGWPGGLLRESVDGPGILRAITGTDPAAGSEILEAVPANTRWRLVGLRFPLVTDATVAARRVNLYVDDGTTIALRVPCGDTQAASLNQQYNAAAWGFAPVLADLQAQIALPADFFLLQGWRIRTNTTSLQAGDNFGAPQMIVEEWIEA